MNEKKFEDALQELEKIVTEMESEGLGLDDSIKKYESGIKLAVYCKDKLNKAEKKIEILTRKPDGTVDLKDFSDNNSNESVNVPVSIETKNDVEETVSIKPEIGESEENIEVSKLSDSTETVEESDSIAENIEIDQSVETDDIDSAVDESSKEESIENKPEEIESYDDNSSDIKEVESEDKLDDIEKNKPKKVHETKPQEHEETFEDLLF